MSQVFHGHVDVIDGDGRKVFRFDPRFAVLDLGARGNEGDLRLVGDDGETKMHLDGGRQLVVVTNAGGTTVFRFDGDHSALDLGTSPGGHGAGANVRLRAADGDTRIHLDAQADEVFIAGLPVRAVVTELMAKVAALEARLAAP